MMAGRQRKKEIPELSTVVTGASKLGRTASTAFPAAGTVQAMKPAHWAELLAQWAMPPAQ